MAKATPTTKTAVAKQAAKKTAVAQRVVRSAAATNAKQAANPETAMFQVLEPFWLGGAVVKPAAPNGAPVFVEMTPAEAEDYQAAGVLGTEAGEAPAAPNDPPSDEANPAGGEPPAGAADAQ
jgi:hypothetical protein